jgi:cadmium resistance protein CadD (predicted permease)
MNGADKIAGDIVSISVVVGTLAQWLPSLAAIISIVWGLIRIYETQTIQRLLGKNSPPPGTNA